MKHGFAARDLDAVRLPASEFPSGLRDEASILLNQSLAPTTSIAAGHIRWLPTSPNPSTPPTSSSPRWSRSCPSASRARGARGKPAFEAIGAAADAELASSDLSTKFLFDALTARGTTLGTMV